MPKLYKRNCDYCGKYYESAARYFCCYHCSTEFRRGKTRLHVELPEDKLRDLYIKKKHSIEMIADYFGVGNTTIRRKFKKFNISIRNYKDAQMNAIETGRLGRGEKHPGWKGGRKYRKNGYNAILKPGHPRAYKDGYVQEHIIVWEEANKKSLPDGWVIHHINGVKNDNRIKNLEAMPLGKHNSWLVMKAQAKRIQELESKLLELNKTQRL